MSQPLPLWHRISFDRLYIALVRRIGWVGFPARELSDRVRDIVQEHGIKKVSAALFEIATWEGNRIRLNLRANKVSGGLLGPRPGEQVAFYQDCDPAYRPKDWDQPPTIPPGGPDPLMEGLYRLTAGDLESRLRQARASTRLHPEEPSEVEAVESEFIRRGMEIPPEDPSEEKPAEARPKRSKGRKAK